MPNPLDTLKAYFASPGDGSASSPYAPWQKTAQGAVEAGTQGLLGALGLGDDASMANRGGQLASAALPLMAPHPAISALLKALGGAPEALDANRMAAGEKLGGWVPHRSAVTPPEGFELGGTNPFVERDPALVDRYAHEQMRTVIGKPLDTTYGRAPYTRDVKPARKSSGSAPASGFESKFDWKRFAGT